MPAPPSKNDIAGSGATPSNAQARSGFGALWECLFGASGLLGATGDAADARAALGVPATNNAALTGNPTATTQASTDNSTRIATTAWAKFGFAVLWSANGYIKLPDWLGGWVVEWGLGSGASGSTGVTFPLAFPTACRAAYATMAATASVSTILGCTINSISTTGMAVTRQYWNGTSLGGAGEAFYWLAIGN